MWYMGGYGMNTCLATSSDGIRWDRPSLRRRQGHEHRARRGARFEHGLARSRQRRRRRTIQARVLQRQRRRTSCCTPPTTASTFSAGGWRVMGAIARRSSGTHSARCGCSAFAPTSTAGIATASYYETRDFVSASWAKSSPPLWTGADSADLRRPEYNTPPELYCLDCVAYESLVLGMFTIWHGERPEREKPNDISLGYSRDGFHWTRPSRDAFIGVSENPGAWNWANVQSAGGCCLVVGDRLYFYVSGRQGDPAPTAPGSAARAWRRCVAMDSRRSPTIARPRNRSGSRRCRQA